MTAGREPGAAPARSGRAADAAVAALRSRIITGELADGATLPAEAALMAEFGISRPTMREAIRVLEAQGLLTINRGPRGGAVVHVPDGASVVHEVIYFLCHRKATIQDVREAKVALEARSAALLASRRPRPDLASLHALVDEVDRLLDARELVAATYRQSDFHREIVRLIRNPFQELMEEVATGLFIRLQMAQNVEFPFPAQMRRARAGLRDHAAVLDLIARGEADAAMELWMRHCERLYRFQLTAERARQPLTIADFDLQHVGDPGLHA